MNIGQTVRLKAPEGRAIGRILELHEHDSCIPPGHVLLELLEREDIWSGELPRQRIARIRDVRTLDGEPLGRHDALGCDICHDNLWDDLGDYYDD